MRIVINNKTEWKAAVRAAEDWRCDKPEPKKSDYPVGLLLKDDSWTWVRLDPETDKPIAEK